jgi:hypothetical protein
MCSTYRTRSWFGTICFRTAFRSISGRLRRLRPSSRSASYPMKHGQSRRNSRCAGSQLSSAFHNRSTSTLHLGEPFVDNGFTVTKAAILL